MGPQTSAVVEEVKCDAGSPRTCSPTTLAQLRKLLLDEDFVNTSGLQKLDLRVKSGRSTASRSNPSNKSGGTDRKKGHDNSKTGQACHLLANEKVGLATEIVNRSLKSLNDVLKKSTKDADGQDALSLPSAKGQSRHFTAPTSRPLQSIAINQMPSSSIVKKENGGNSEHSEPWVSPTLSLIECSRVAFAYLWSSKGQKSDVDPMQMLTGNSALVGKIIALGHHVTALKELRTLRKRLLATMAINEPVRDGKHRIGKRQGANEPSETIPELLTFINAHQAPRAIIRLIVATQLQIMRILITVKNPVDHGAIHTALAASSPDSPVNLITIITESSQVQKSAQQLESLSHMCFALCPTSHKLFGEKTSDKGYATDPRSALSLQGLALEIRLRWWQLSGHKKDVEAEIFDPAARFIVAFSRNSILNEQENYDFAKCFYDRLTICVSEHLKVKIESDEMCSVSFLRAMGSLCESALHYEDAISFYARALGSLQNSDSKPMVIYSLKVKMATVMLRDRTEDSSWSRVPGLLEDITSTLHGNLSGSVSVLTNLATELSSLRRALLSTLEDLLCDHSQTSARQREVGHLFLGACIAFHQRLLQHVDCKAEEGLLDSDGNMIPDKAAKELESASLRAIDSLVNYCRRLVAATCVPIKFQEIETLMRGSLGLVYTVAQRHTHDKNGEQDTNLGLLRVKISHVHWALYVRLKGVQSNSTGADLLQCLRASVDAASDLTLEQRRAALLSVKAERLGLCARSHGHLKDSHRAYQISIRQHIENGVLNPVLEEMKHGILRDVWTQGDEISALGRVLSAAVDVALKLGQTERQTETRDLFFDDNSQDGALRIILLTQQLRIASEGMQVGTGSEAARYLIRAICARLVSIFETKAYPVRQTLFQIQILEHLSDGSATFLSEDLFEDALEQVVLDVDELNKDSSLRGHVAIVGISRAIAIELHSTSIDPSKLASLVQDASTLFLGLDAKMSIHSVVYNLDHFVSQMTSVADLFGVKACHVERLTALEVIAAIRNKQGSNARIAGLQDLTRLALQHADLGFPSNGLEWFAAAERLVRECKPDSTDRLNWYLANVEMSYLQGEYDDAQRFLHSCEQIFEACSDVNRDAAKFRMAEAQGFYLHSLLSFQNGRLVDAFSSAQKALRLRYRMWSHLEKLESQPACKDNESSSASFADKTISGDNSLELLSGSRFWALVPTLLHCLDNLADLFAHVGVLQEATYYTQQAEKVARSVASQPWIAHFQAKSGDFEIKKGNHEKARTLLLEADRLNIPACHGRVKASIECSLASLSASENDPQEASRHFALAEEALDNMSTVPQTSSRRMDDLMAKFEELSVKRTTKKTQPKMPRPAPKQQKPTKISTATSRQKPGSAGLSHLFSSAKSHILRLRARLALDIDPHVAEDFISAAAALMTGDNAGVMHREIVAKQLLYLGLEQIASNSLFCVLPESTISMPFSSEVLTTPSEDLLPECAAEPAQVPARSRSAGVRGSKRGAGSKISVESKFVQYLIRSRNEIFSTLGAAYKFGSTAMLHSLSSTLSRIMSLLSATASLCSEASVHPLVALYALEFSRSVAFQRQNIVSGIERPATKVEKSHSWPSWTNSANELETFPKDVQSFREDYIENIPSQWNVISISLSDTKQELYISKLRSNQSPFLLCLPLGRHNSRDADEEVFDFEQVHRELLQIINSANTSTHSAKDMTAKGAKTKWWQQRNELDTQLHEHLSNIEKFWLGGFKGIFSQHEHDGELLGKFQASFDDTLKMHLPSRKQKGQRQSRKSYVRLDSRILELFVDLGNPQDDPEIDEKLTDLLYFVVDIFQFHGERNAYDEIDFDSMTVQIIDALRAYHDAAGPIASRDTHTILILDKSLHFIPWESLPSLKGYPMSRMPSLGALKDSISHQLALQSSEGTFEMSAKQSSGCYILNPSGDLNATQKTFEKPLNSLSSWSSIIRRDPTEDEFEQALASKDIVLYFGHGSGAQFIRAKTIKRLQKCATTLLMGCSSGVLSEAGEFEPHGTPLNYMQANCPALVATLWDVTDKDIDRFSQKTFADWGLLPNDDDEKVSKLSKATKSKGARSAAPPPHSWTPNSTVSLCEAVSNARDACVLKYLNGAAPVVYGIPMFLSS